MKCTGNVVIKYAQFYIRPSVNICAILDKNYN
jgi:hypothetical protein